MSHFVSESKCTVCVISIVWFTNKWLQALLVSETKTYTEWPV